MPPAPASGDSPFRAGHFLIRSSLEDNRAAPRSPGDEEEQEGALTRHFLIQGTAPAPGSSHPHTPCLTLKQQGSTLGLLDGL